MTAIRGGGKKVSVVKKNVAKVAPRSSQVTVTGYDDRKNSTSTMAPVSLHWNDDTPENVVVLPCLKSMTWAMENKNSAPGNRVAVINLKAIERSFEVAVRVMVDHEGMESLGWPPFKFRSVGEVISGLELAILYTTR
ncbi:unnamed protein product [Prunus brigantina]